MQEYSLSKENYELLKGIDLSELGDKVKLDDDSCTFWTSDIRLLQTIIDEEITAKGLDENQNLCIEFGRRLYGLYDEILFIKRDKYSSDK